MQILELVEAHEARGGWRLSNRHIGVLKEFFPESRDILGCLHSDPDCATADFQRHPFRLASMLLASRYLLDVHDWPNLLEWTVSFDALENIKTLVCPENLTHPTGRVFRLSLGLKDGKCKERLVHPLLSPLTEGWVRKDDTDAWRRN